MEKTFDPKKIEASTYQIWEEKGYFSPTGKGSPYCIMIPPPNVTGQLHMGHGFQYTLMDCLVRYNRMKGNNTLWQMGTDHAGISTQMVVERKLAKEGSSRHALGREKFVDKIWEWKHESGTHISRQIRRMGASVDWSSERFTLDEGLSKSVHKVFISLYEEGLLYRGKRLVNWDPKFQTAISDLEVINEEEKGFLWHIRYPLSDGSGHLIVATTRPETLLGDTAVAVHPDDHRYQKFIGKTINLPLTDRQIPIIADDYVEPEFGSGCVKITPAHDFNDYAMGQRHKLPLINILTPDAHLNETVPAAYQGLERFSARKKMVEDLQQQDLIEKIEDYTLKVPRGDRSGVIIEPYLTDQWFVKAKVLAEPALKAVKNGEIKFIPENWNKTYYQWLENIEDWCISRQLWWGHRIPAWYDEKGELYVGDSEQAIREKYQLDDSITLHQDEDVLDTWFSSALWPFSTLGWPEKTPKLSQFYPTSVLITGFDIIFFWVARMVMMGIKFMGEIPFKEIYITGLIRDAHGQKMSKSKGNVLDPIDLIDGISLEDLINKRAYGLMQPQMEKKIKEATQKEFPNGITGCGTDALRFTFCALASNTRNIRFDYHRLEGYRNFCNKLWNAARYVLMQVEKYPTKESTKEFTLADRWIQSALQHTIQEYTRQLDQYRFDLAAQSMYDFIWNEYCDWYLELSKPVFNNPDSSDALKNGAKHTLLEVLETILRLLHPMTPYITETIWQSIASLCGHKEESIMLRPFPEADNTNFNEGDSITWLKQCIIGVRTIRAEMNIAPSKPLPLYLANASTHDKHAMKQCKEYLMSLAKIESLHFLSPEDEKPPAATALVDQLELLIPLSGLIDKDAEISRLNREIEKISKELLQINSRLGNESFVKKAPQAVVDKEQARQKSLQEAHEKLQTQQSEIRGL
jgi:valyl-tRNA synthetase